MEWIINIENEPKLRIMVVYDVMKNELMFFGQHRIKNQWTVFSELVTEPNIDSQKIEESIYVVYNNMKGKLVTYENISNEFKDIKVIEIKNTDN